MSDACLVRWKNGLEKKFASWCCGDHFHLESAKHLVDSSSVERGQRFFATIDGRIAWNGFWRTHGKHKKKTGRKKKRMTDNFVGFDDPAASTPGIQFNSSKMMPLHKRIERDCAHLEFFA